MDAETGVPETMIAFKRADDLPTVQSIISGAGSLNWERFVTNRWVFMHANPPRWLPRGPQAESFVKEAYAQLHGIWGGLAGEVQTKAWFLFSVSLGLSLLTVCNLSEARDDVLNITQ
jgi:hypothetical protein